MSKMDRQGARTVADLERRYNFGKSFSEVLGIANDAQTHAYQAEEAVEKLERTVSELSIFVLDEETGLNAKLEAKLDKDKLVSQFNLAANEITITSDNFTLTADGTIKASKGLIGKWNITDSGISKITDSYFVQLKAPGSDTDLVLGVLPMGDDGLPEMDATLGVFANGDIQTRGQIYCSNASGSRYTNIQAGTMIVNGEYLEQ